MLLECCGGYVLYNCCGGHISARELRLCAPLLPQPVPAYVVTPRPSLLPLPLQVIAAVTQFVADHGLAGKPLILWGASSGGTLALKLPGTLAALAQPAAGTEAAAGQVAAQQAVVGPSLKVAGIISGGYGCAGGVCCWIACCRMACFWMACCWLLTQEHCWPANVRVASDAGCGATQLS